MQNRSEYLLEAYFAHTLTASEAEELKALIQSEPGLAAEMRFQQQLARSVQDKSLRNGIASQEWAEATKPPRGDGSGTAMKRNMWTRYLYSAAAVVALLVLAWIFIPQGNTADLIAEQTAPFPNKMTFKSLGQEAKAVPQDVLRAFALYDQQKYPEAAAALEAVVNDYPEMVDYRFYWGVSLVHTRQYAQAAKTLEPVAQSQNEYKTVSLYYLGLAYAAIQETDKAKTTLQQYLDAPDGVTYRKQVLKVLDSLLKGAK